MKLQFLGDAPDAFKWDLLHWICTRSSPRFDEFVFVPMLTPDIEGSNEGRTPHHRFECRNFIRSFVASLKAEPRSLTRINTLGAAEPNLAPFRVSIFEPERYIGSGSQRAEYWSGFVPEKLANSVVFLDPDNGFETKTQRGTKWIRHAELKDLLLRLPQSSIAVVYQHRPHRTWVDLFEELKESLEYVHTLVVVYEGNLAFVAIAGAASGGKRILPAIQSYANEHPVVRHIVLKDSHA